MGDTNFLEGDPERADTDLPQNIEDLRDASIIFVQRWSQGDLQRASRVSREAMALFDFIVSEFMRERGEHRRHGGYAGSAFEREMNKVVAHGVTGVTIEDQERVYLSGPGKGRVPGNVGSPVSLSLERLLNKIKHRNIQLGNFRIENGKHIFVICPENHDASAEGIVEFDVATFCDACLDAINAI